MSLFSNIKTFAQNLVGPTISKDIYVASNSALTVLTKPIQSITGRFDKAYATTEKQSTVSLVAQADTNALLAVAPFSSGIRGAAASTLSKLSPTTKIIGVGVAAVGIPYFAANPSKIPEFSGLPAAGADIPKEPNLQVGIDYVKAHPYVSAAALTLALGSLGFGAASIANILSNYSNTQAIKDNTSSLTKPPTITDNDSDYQNQMKLIEAQTKAQQDLIKSNTQAQEQLIEAQAKANKSLPTGTQSAPVVSTGKTPTPKKKKAKKKAKKKNKGKPRKKKKGIKRKKNKK